MSHCWKMTVTALESVTHRYCLVFSEQRIVRDTSAEGQDQTASLQYIFHFIHSDSPIPLTIILMID